MAESFKLQREKETVYLFDVCNNDRVGKTSHCSCFCVKSNIKLQKKIYGCLLTRSNIFSAIQMDIRQKELR